MICWIFISGVHNFEFLQCLHIPFSEGKLTLIEGNAIDLHGFKRGAQATELNSSANKEILVFILKAIKKNKSSAIVSIPEHKSNDRIHTWCYVISSLDM